MFVESMLKVFWKQAKSLKIIKRTFDQNLIMIISLLLKVFIVHPYYFYDSSDSQKVVIILIFFTYCAFETPLFIKWQKRNLQAKNKSFSEAIHHERVKIAKEILIKNDLFTRSSITEIRSQLNELIEKKLNSSTMRASKWYVATSGVVLLSWLVLKNEDVKTLADAIEIILLCAGIYLPFAILFDVFEDYKNIHGEKYFAFKRCLNDLILKLK